MTDLNFSLQRPADLTTTIHNDDQLIPTFEPFHQLTHSQPTRATCFHPTGETYVVGSNSRILTICHYTTQDIIDHLSNRDDENESLKSNKENTDNELLGSSLEENYFDTRLQLPLSPKIAFQFLRIHRGSVYCASFNQKGDLLATGSNDQTVNIIRYNASKHEPTGDESRLMMHKGTVRDLCFMKGEKSHHLLTAGAGDYEIYVSDCDTMKPVQSFKGHEAAVMSLHNWDSPVAFVSGSLDGTIRMWDLRMKNSTSVISKLDIEDPKDSRPISNGNGNRHLASDGDSLQDEAQPNIQESTNYLNAGTLSPVGVVRVDPTGRLLVSGHKDGSCMLYDIRGKRTVQTFQAHENEIRTLNFGPKSYYLLTGSYDGKIKLMDLQGDLTRQLPSVDIAELDDKIIQTAWHPTEYNFVATCANGTATLWTKTIATK